jgi:nucleotide-binding universal stress UspA family protein
MTEAAPFRRILAGTDGSERAEETVRQAARLASATGAVLEVVFVLDSGRPHDDAEGEADGVLGRGAAIAQAEGITADARMVPGDPATALLEEAELDEVDLLCVGQDAGLLGGAIRVGQVAGHVLRETRCSVLVGRRAGPDFPARIQCGVDGSEGSDATAALAARIAAATAAELRVVHVVPVFRGDETEWTLAEGEEGPSEIRAPVEAAIAAGVTPVREMAMGRPEHALVKVAGRDGADLLVVGHRGVSGIRRVLLGSVSEYTAHHAPCSVLVARLPGPDS